MSGSSPKSISISGVETDITIGKELAAVAQKSKALASRDCFEQLEMYLHGRSHDRVCLLFGLLQTGKNTMLRQAIGRMTKEDLSRIAYIKARRTDNMAMMNRDLKKLFNAGFRYVFIDEVTLMEDFIDSAALFSDVFATMGMKIVLSGTDSLGFWLAMDEELYDRAKSIHTTFIPYREYSRLLGIDSIDEYIRYGGTLPPHEEQKSAGHSPLQPHDCHSAGVWAIPWRGVYGLSLLHRNGYTTDGERLAAIYRKVQHAAQLLPICNIIVNQHPSDNREKGLLFPTTVGIILHCFSGSSRRIFVM